MDLGKVSETTAKQLSSFLDTFIIFFTDPRLRYKPIPKQETTQIVLPRSSVRKEVARRFNPGLFYYALICISIGTSIQATIPNETDPDPIGKAVVVAIVLFLWITNALLISVPAKFLSKNFNRKEFISSIIQAYSTLYLVSSVLALLLWIVFEYLGPSYRFSEMTSLWYYPVHIFLSFIYVPWTSIKAIQIEFSGRIVLTLFIWLLIVVFEALSIMFWVLFHFAAYA